MSFKNRIDKYEIEFLFAFLAEKVRHVTAPLPLWQLSREFQELTGDTYKVGCVNYRINSHCHCIHQMNQFDTETKVKLMFALSAPVDFGFLEELKTHAKVVLDESHRIIEYKENGIGGLELKGTHLHRRPILTANDKRILYYLAEKAENAVSPMNDYDLLTDFKQITEVTDTIESLKKRYLIVKREIYSYPEFDIQTKIRMMFVSGACVKDYVLKELKKDAEIVLDKKHRITSYKANDGSLELNVENRWSAKRTGNTEDDPNPSLLKRLCASIKPEPATLYEDGNDYLTRHQHILLLESIQTIFTILDLRRLDELSSKIDSEILKIQNFENRAELKLTEIRDSVITSIRCLSSENDEKNADETMSRKEFIQIFRTALIGLKFAILNECDAKLREMIEELKEMDKDLPIKTVVTALQTIVDFIAP